MGYFKKFSDFCSGFAAFTALIYLFRQYMSHSFEDLEGGMTEKIKLFFSQTDNIRNHTMLILALTFTLSVIGGRLLARFPHVSVIFCIPPLLLTADMIRSSLIDEYPMLYAVLAVIAVVGCVAECVARDREDGKKRSAHIGNIVSLMLAAFCFFVARMSDALLTLEDSAGLNSFEYEIFRYSQDMDMKVFYIFAAVYALLAVIGFILSDIYFIDAFLALPPMIALIYLWGAECLTVHSELLTVFSVTVFAVRAIPAISGRAIYKTKLSKNKNISKKRS